MLDDEHHKQAWQPTQHSTDVMEDKGTRDWWLPQLVTKARNHWFIVSISVIMLLISAITTVGGVSGRIIEVFTGGQEAKVEQHIAEPSGSPELASVRSPGDPDCITLDVDATWSTLHIVEGRNNYEDQEWAGRWGIQTFYVPRGCNAVLVGQVKHSIVNVGWQLRGRVNPHLQTHHCWWIQW